MSWLYSLTIYVYGLAIRIASIWNRKAKRWIVIRTNWELELREIGQKYPKPILIHCASVGEYQQAKPIIREIKTRHADIPIVISFFSPSGYDQFDQDDLVSTICALPLDTAKNMNQFVRLLNPRLVIIVKYEFWYNLLFALIERGVPTFWVAVYIHKRHILERIGMSFLRDKLKKANGVFVQDKVSFDTLIQLGFENARLSGDTRVEEVLLLPSHQYENKIIENLKGNRLCLIAGSTHPKDEKLLANLRLHFPDHLFVIFPHEWDKIRLLFLRQDFGDRCAIYSDLENGEVEYRCDTLIVNTQGQLKYAYRYADIAYIGGGFDRGVHSMLEPLAYRIPLIIGPNNNHFLEANELTNQAIASVVSNSEDLQSAYRNFIEEEYRDGITATIKNYLSPSRGISHEIVNILDKYLI